MLKKMIALLLMQVLVLTWSAFPVSAEEPVQETMSTSESETTEALLEDDMSMSDPLAESDSTSQISGQSSETMATTQSPTEVVPGASSLVPSVEIPSDIQVLIQNGDWVKAHEALLKLWKETSDPVSKDQIEKTLSDVNTQLLSSKTGFPGATEYKVKSGDSLYVIAKKYKTSVRIIQTINGLKSDIIRPGQKLKVLRGNFSISVNKTDNVLKLFLGDAFFKRYSIATGTTKDLTPVGTFTISTKLENPTWFKAGVKAIPPGTPENLLGTRWLGFSKPGFGIHGTTDPSSIGQHATSGCVRMLNSEVEELYDLVPAGTKVTIVE